MQPLASPFCAAQLAGKGIFADKIEVSCGDKFEGEFTESDEAGVILLGFLVPRWVCQTGVFCLLSTLKVRCRIRPGHSTCKVFALDKSILGTLFLFWDIEMKLQV